MFKKNFVRSLIALLVVIMLSSCQQSSIADVSGTAASPAIEKDVVISPPQIAVAAAEVTEAASSSETSSQVSTSSEVASASSKEESSSKAVSSTAESSSKEVSSVASSSSKPKDISFDLPVTPPIAVKPDINEEEPSVWDSNITYWPENWLDVELLGGDNFVVTGAVCNNADYGGSTDSIKFSPNDRKLTCTVTQPGDYFITIKCKSTVTDNVVSLDTVVSIG